MAILMRWQTPWPVAEAREQLARALGPTGLNAATVEPPDPTAIAFRLDGSVVVAHLEAMDEGTAIRLEMPTWDPRLLDLEQWLSPPPPGPPPEAPFAGP